MIVKNEAENLPRCLRSVRNHVDELVVVDTGSEDETVTIAQSFGAKIAHFTWCDDFAAARNFAASQVTGTWILTLDADEELIVESPNWREALQASDDILAYEIDRLDVGQPITALHLPRIQRNLSDLQYVGRYHEQLTYQQHSLKTTQLQPLSSLKILHYGYEAASLAAKNLHRDIPLLERIREQEPLSLLLLLTLANNYLRTDQLEKAQVLWAEALERLSPHLLSGELPSETVRLPALLFTLGLDLLSSQEDYESAMLICRQGLAWFPTYPPLHHLTGMVLREVGLPLGATAYFKQCLQMGETGHYWRQESFDRAFLDVFPAYELGLTYLNLARLPEATEAFELALRFDPSYEPAQEGLEQVNQRGGAGKRSSTDRSNDVPN